MAQKNRPCYEVTPGICKTDVLYGQVKRLHAQMRIAMASLGCAKKDDGKSFFLVAGHARKRNVMQALAQKCPARIGADTFIAMCLSDQLDARLGLKTFTICDFDLAPGDEKFEFSTVLTLLKRKQRLVEGIWPWHASRHDPGRTEALASLQARNQSCGGAVRPGGSDGQPRGASVLWSSQGH